MASTLKLLARTMRFATDRLATRVVCPKAASPEDELYTLSEHTKPWARRDKSRVCIAGVRPVHAHVLYNSGRKRAALAQVYGEKVRGCDGWPSFEWSTPRYLLLSWRLLRDRCTFSGARPWSRDRRDLLCGTVDARFGARAAYAALVAMNFFDVRKWYSFVSLQPPPPPHAYDGRRHPRGGGGAHDNFRAPRGYVDIAPTCDSRWEWDRSLRERPRRSSRQLLRGALSEDALADDASSQPATPRNYLRKASGGQRAGPASATEESPAGTDVLSSSWEAGTPRSERSRKDYAAPRVSVDDSVLYERISRFIGAEGIEVVSDRRNSEAAPPLQVNTTKPTTTQCQETLEQCAADKSGEEVVDVVCETMPDRRSNARTSGKWSAKLFRHSASKAAVYQTVQKEKKGAFVSLSQEELPGMPSELEQCKDRALSGDLGPPVPAKSWEVKNASRTDEQESSTKVQDALGIACQLEPPTLQGDDQSKQSTLTHLSSMSTEQSSAKQQLPSQFEEAPQSSGKWGRKLFGRPKTKVRNESHKEEKEKHYSGDNESYNADVSVNQQFSDKEVSRDTGMFDSGAAAGSDVTLKNNTGSDTGYHTHQDENLLALENALHSVPAPPVRNQSLEERNLSSTWQCTLDSPESVHNVPHTDARPANEVPLFTQEQGREPIGREAIPLHAEAQAEIIYSPTPPGKSPGRKKGFFKFPSFKKKKKLSASSIEEAVPPTSAEPEPVATEPEKSLSFDEILAELRKQQTMHQTPISTEPMSPLHGQLKKVPPPVPPKSWKTTANLNLSTEYQENSVSVDQAEIVEHVQSLPLASGKNSLQANATLPNEGSSPENTLLAKENTGDESVSENLQLPVKSFFDQEHELTVLQAESNDALSSSPTEWSYSTFLRGYSEDIVDSSPRRRHNLRLLADVSVSSDALPAITEARNLHVSDSIKLEQSAGPKGTLSALKPVDRPLPVEHIPASDQQEYFLYKPSTEAKSMPRTKLFNLKAKKQVEVEDSCREIVAAACERYEPVADVEESNEDLSISKLSAEPCQEAQADPASTANEVLQEFEEPSRTKERRFSLKLSSMRKKKVDKPTKKPDSYEQPRILAALRQENKPRLPVDKGNMMDAYLRSLEMQPKSQLRNQSDDSLDLSFVS